MPPPEPLAGWAPPLLLGSPVEEIFHPSTRQAHGRAQKWCFQPQPLHLAIIYSCGKASLGVQSVTGDGERH